MIKRTGRRIQLFNMIDDFDREGLGIAVGFPLPPEPVIRSLERLSDWQGRTERVIAALIACANRRGIRVKSIQRGKAEHIASISAL